jgi:hypothetical protein
MTKVTPKFLGTTPIPPELIGWPPSQCRRLLHYKADSASALLKSMQMVLRLDPAVAWDLAPAIANEVPHPSPMHTQSCYFEGTKDKEEANRTPRC